jgi:hypothetical protein
MKRTKTFPDDPVVEEVRTARQKIWKNAGGTFGGLLKLLDRTVSDGKKGKPVRRRRGRASSKNR